MDAPYVISSPNAYHLVNDINKQSSLSLQSDLIHKTKLLLTSKDQFDQFTRFIGNLYLSDPHPLKKTCHAVLEYLYKKRGNDTISICSEIIGDFCKTLKESTSMGKISLLLNSSPFNSAAVLIVFNCTSKAISSRLLLLQFNVYWLNKFLIEWNESTSTIEDSSIRSVVDSEISKKCMSVLENIILLVKIFSIDTMDGVKFESNLFVTIPDYIISLLPEDIDGPEKEILPIIASKISSLVATLLLDKRLTKDAATQASLLLLQVEYVNLQPETVNIYFANKVASFFMSVSNNLSSGLDGLMEKLSEIPRLAMCRAIINATPSDVLCKPEIRLLVQSSLLNYILSSCEAHIDVLKCYAFETLDCYLKRAIRLIYEKKMNINIEVLDQLFGIVSLHWENPSRKIHHNMTPIFKLLVEISVAQDHDLDFQRWRQKVIVKLLNAPLSQRGQYPALNVLVTSFGANKLLSLAPNLLERLISAIVNSINISSVAMRFFVSLLIMLAEESSSTDPVSKKKIINHEAAWYHLVLPLVVDALVLGHTTTRNKISQYVIPEILKIHSGVLSPLLYAIRTYDMVKSPLSKNNKLWALIDILKSSRKLGIIDGSNFTVNQALDDVESKEWWESEAEHDFLKIRKSSRYGKRETEKTEKKEQATLNVSVESKDFIIALSHADPDIRFSALEFLCGANTSTKLLSFSELSCLKAFLRNGIKDDDQKFCNGAPNHLKKILQRIRDSCKAYKKSLSLIASNNDQYAKSLKQIEKIVEMESDIIKFIVSQITLSIYPGSPFTRLFLPLKIFSLLIEVYPLNFSEEISELILDKIYTNANLCLLIDTLGNPREVIRNLSYDIISQFPSPLPGISTPPILSNIFKIALHLTGSPRFCECDNGALLLLTFFHKFIFSPKSSNFFFNFLTGEVTKSEEIDLSERITGFLDQINLLCMQRTSSLFGGTSMQVKDLSSWFSTTQGLILSTRYIIEDLSKISFEGLFLLRKWAEGAVKMATASLLESLQIVADDDRLDEESKNATYKSKGQINSKQTLQLDCRGHIICDEDFANEEDSEAIVVAAWLNVRECTALLGSMVSLLYLPDYGRAKEDLHHLTYEQVKDIGMLLLRCILTTKHLGAVENAGESFKIVCERLFKCNKTNPPLCALPSQWLSFLLQESRFLESEFLLRRSSGFAQALCAILQAEPSNSDAILFSTAVKELLRHADGENWRERVHSLNILKRIVNDGAFSNIVQPFLPSICISAVNSFDYPLWAVRNSAMMVFSGMMKRATGYGVGSNGNQRITFSTFFSKFPSLYNFLLNSLVHAANKSLDLLHPALYPILFLLSKLKADTLDLDVKDFPFDKFLPVVVAATSQKHWMIRQMAAQVFAVLQHITSVQINLVNLLKSVNLNWSTKPCNLTHGQLQQILYLLKSVSNEDDFSSVSEALVEGKYSIIHLLTASLQFLGIESEIGHLRYMLILILEEFISSFLDGTNFTILLTKFSINGGSAFKIFYDCTVSKCRELLKSIEIDKFNIDSGYLLLIKKAAEVIVKWILGHSSPDVLYLAFLLSFENLADVRLSTVKCIKRFLKNGNMFSIENSLALLSAVRKQIERETHFQALRHQLHLFNMVCYSDESLIIDNVLELFDFVVALYLKFDNNGIKSRTLELMGICISQFESFESMEITPRIQHWIIFLNESVQESNPINQRGAVAVSINNSKLLGKERKISKTINNSEYSSIWIIALKLLDDDVDLVRREIGNAITSSLDTIIDAEYNSEQLKILTLNYLKIAFPKEPVLFRFLFESIKNLLTLDYSPRISKKVFEIEDVNSFVEELNNSKLLINYFHFFCSSSNNNSDDKNILINLAKVALANYKVIYDYSDIANHMSRKNNFFIVELALYVLNKFV